MIIAIDGFAACGKSTLARNLALKLGFLYLDTGSMYRALSLYFLRRSLDWNDPKQVDEVLQDAYLQFIPNSKSRLMEMHLNGEEVEDAIRSMQVSSVVSELAQVSAIRRHLVSRQREMAAQGDVVLDGRDIGTVVFPEAELKFFVRARMEVRVQRRFDELISKGHQVSALQIQENLEKRDREETQREDSPLRQAEDAVLLDSSDVSADELLELALSYYRALPQKP